MSTWKIVLLVSALGAVSIHGFASEVRPEQRLRSASVFAFGGIGFAGLPAAGETALRELVKGEDSLALLESVFGNGTPEAKCYVLVGLRTIAPAAFEKYATLFRMNPPERVFTMSGCLAGMSSGLAILADIEARRYSVHIVPKKANKAPELTTTSVTSPAAQETRQP
jgi:hypothetical protein